MAGATQSTLDELVQAILSDEAISAGTKPAPSSASKAECQTVLKDFYATHVQADLSLRAVAERMKRRIACEDGCNYCCESLILISGPEADAVVSAVLEADDRGLRERVVAAAERWRESCGARAEHAAQCFSGRRTGEYMTLMLDHAFERQMCPLNENGRCTVYAVRPLPCRQGWALDNAERCLPSRDPNAAKVQRVTHAKYEDFLAMGRRVTAGLQSAMGQGVQRKPLALVVLDRFEGDTPELELIDDLGE